MRGAPAPRDAPRQDEGIIPARAGSTKVSCGIQVTSEDHPRSCGEHSAMLLSTSEHAGSSPLVRGAPGAVPGYVVLRGIIPARAGSTRSWWHMWRLRTDHPRSCGEHDDTDSSAADASGSSPLVRGAPRIVEKRWRRAGIIPARAGSTSRHSPGSSRPRDHPRSCGEHCLENSVKLNPEGSSPLVRGALFTSALRFSKSRIIPARAGSTRRCGARRSGLRDHPRSCGEHT